MSEHFSASPESTQRRCIQRFLGYLLRAGRQAGRQTDRQALEQAVAMSLPAVRDEAISRREKGDVSDKLHSANQRNDVG
jgi:hypothetical protein